MRWGRAKNSYGNTTTTKLIKKQGGFGQDSVQSFQEKFMKYSMVRPSCTISKTNDDGISIDMLGRILIKNVKKFPVTILQQAFFGVKLLASQICKAFAWKGQFSLPSYFEFATGIQSS